ncbi:MAG TPA: hypothetical protein VHT25_09060 [Solirubrobacteraceae bacterium]|jgi:hypothetical protein|nr:hypothetical protein [Solirubrobacteraceae bacterium]
MYAGNRRSRASSLIVSIAIACVAGLLLFGYGKAAGQGPLRPGNAAPADGAAGSSSPAAEIGRCAPARSVKEGRSNYFFGQYANAGCTRAAPDDGRFQWTAGAGAVGFTSSASGVAFSMTKKPRIHCAAASGAGEYTGDSGVIVRFTFTNCASGRFACHGSAQPPGVIVSSLLGGEVGLLNAAEGQVGVELAPINASEPDFADFECPIPVQLKGSVVGKIPNFDRMSTAIRFRFSVKNGVQKYAGLEGHEPALLTLTAGTGENARTETAGLRMLAAENSEEAVEVRASSY